MKGWAKLQKCIYEIKQEQGASFEEIQELLKHCLKENKFLGYMNEKARRISNE
ncbi:hypothetical protein [Halocella sp. SP3-1]|uniref:hypothetical protein n=1 Tax=Halocella sp. SP3-1 TaxID=2382161 RepID=UPI0013DECE1D|nr:hypothetical protein [Halocella sp. SP3-1]